MRVIQNEKGYSLALILVVVIVTFILFSTFTLSATNLHKQVTKTDDSFEATAIAEMGIEYYKERILYLVAEYQNTTTDKGKITKSYLDQLTNYIDSNKENIAKGKPPSNYNEKIKEYIAAPKNLLLDDIDLMLLGSKNVQIDVSTNDYYLIEEYNNTINTWTITLKGFLDAGSKYKSIQTTFELPESFQLITLDGEINNKLPELIIESSTFDNLIARKPTPFDNFVINIKPTVYSFSGNNFVTSSNIDDPSSAEIHANGDVSIKGINNMNSMYIYSLGAATFQSPFKANNFTLYSNSLDINTLNSLTDSKIEIENQARFQAILNSSKSIIQVNNTSTFDYLSSINSSSIKVNGTTNLNYIDTMLSSSMIVNGDFQVKKYLQNIKDNSTLKIKGDANINSYIQTIENSSMHISKNLNVGYINSFKNSTLLVNGDANFGKHIESMEGSSSIRIGKNATVGKLVVNSGTMDVGGILTITGNNTSNITGGTVIVNSVNFKDDALNISESISVSGSGKLCIREISNITALNGKKIKGTGNGEIIFLNPELDSNKSQKLKLGSDGTGSHNIEAGIEKFNELCGLGNNSGSENYIINTEPLEKERVIQNLNYLD